MQQGSALLNAWLSLTPRIYQLSFTLPYHTFACLSQRTTLILLLHSPSPKHNLLQRHSNHCGCSQHTSSPSHSLLQFRSNRFCCSHALTRSPQVAGMQHLTGQQLPQLHFSHSPPIKIYMWNDGVEVFSRERSVGRAALYSVPTHRVLQCS